MKDVGDGSGGHDGGLGGARGTEKVYCNKPAQ